MINQKYLDMLSHKNQIRVLAEFAAERAAAVGKENVYDYTLGNPSVVPPASFNETIVRLLNESEPVALHGYSPSIGIKEVRDKIAASLNRRFGMDYKGIHIFPTSGAAAAVAHAVRAVTRPGDEVIAFAPLFSEYFPYVNDADRVLKVVPPRYEDFQINFEAFEEMFTSTVTAVLINSPCNPSGVVYTEETLTRLADILRAKSKQYGHNIFLLSDEPYREISFGGRQVPYTAKFYDHVLTCYSFSKCQSVPGERIGYVAVNPRAEHADDLVMIMAQISRGIGHNCPTSLMMRTVGETCDDTSDISIYETNMNLIYDTLADLGFTVVKPDGTFYIFPKCLEDDDAEFCRKAMKYDLIFVPGKGFSAPGYFRMAYCVDTDMVRRSLPVIRRFVEEEYGIRK